MEKSPSQKVKFRNKKKDEKASLPNTLHPPFGGPWGAAGLGTIGELMPLPTPHRLRNKQRPLPCPQSAEKRQHSKNCSDGPAHAQLMEHCPGQQKPCGLVPVRAHTYDVDSILQEVINCSFSHTDVSFSHPSSL